MLDNSNKRRAVLMGALGAIGATVFASASFAQPPYPPMPPPRFEERPPPPNERLFWAAGHWHWNGHAYEWIPGRWVERPRPEAVWVPGEWVARRGAWVWVPAHWR
ncbi:YXWGXW repeat-containing protein [Acetobacteraceae bacterium H6797]|nr:YXWGXW repeat-containing protein [Acetobacteraceae bacterium H6797]